MYLYDLILHFHYCETRIIMAVGSRTHTHTHKVDLKTSSVCKQQGYEVRWTLITAKKKQTMCELLTQSYDRHLEQINSEKL